jgi:pimeloyl-ACP methyl ester carboxylesterase
LSTSKDAYYNNVDLNSHADDFHCIVRTIFEDSAQFDVIAFSLGGRIALNTIASNPVLIRRAHITGVSAEREAMAKIILKSWHDLLSQEEDGSLKAFAWSIILSTYSDSFLAMNGEKRISSWVDHICSNQRRLGLLRLLQQTGTLEPLELVDPILRSNTKVQLAVGENDKISACNQVEKLHTSLNLDNNVLIYEGCGHAVLNEHPAQWRKDALAFLNDV